MKKIAETIVVLGLAVALIGYVHTSGGQFYQGMTTDHDDTAVKKTEEEKEQARILKVQPLAYGDTQGIVLEPGTYLSVIGRSKSSDSYWEQIEKGIYQALDDLNEQLGYSGEDKIQIGYSVPASKDSVSEQVNILDEELALYPSAVAMAEADEAAYQVQFDLALEAGIPLVLFQSGSDYADIEAMCATDNQGAGATVAEQMGQLLEGNGSVLIFASESKAQCTKLRVQGFQEQLEAVYPGVTVLSVCYLDQVNKMAPEIVEYYQADEDPTNDITEEQVTQEVLVQYMLEKNPEVSGCFTVSGTATDLVIAQLEEQKNSTTKVLAFDGGEKRQSYLKAGKLQGFILENPYGMGYATVIACARSIAGLGNEATVDSGYVWVDQTTIDTEEVQDLLY